MKRSFHIEQVDKLIDSSTGVNPEGMGIYTPPPHFEEGEGLYIQNTPTLRTLYL